MKAALAMPMRWFVAVTLSIASLTIGCTGYLGGGESGSAGGAAITGPGGGGRGGGGGAGGAPPDGSGSNAAAAEGSGGDAPDPTMRPAGPSEHLIWLLDGETGSLGDVAAAHDGAMKVQCGLHPGAIEIDDSFPHRAGTHALRAHLDKAWFDAGECTSYKMAMISKKGEIGWQSGEEAWLGFSVFVPDDWKTPGSIWNIVDWHPGPGPGPQVYVKLLADASFRVGFKEGLGAPVDFGTGTKAVWNDFVTRFVISKGRDGHFSLWHREQGQREWSAILDFDGPTMIEQAEFPIYPNMGLFGHWDGPTTQPTVFLDEIRAGAGSASFEEVMPGGGFFPAP
jgi:hypothetical protein